MSRRNGLDNAKPAREALNERLRHADIDEVEQRRIDPSAASPEVAVELVTERAVKDGENPRLR